MKNTGDGILAAVLDYAGRGLCIIPVSRGTKRAARKWTRYQLQRPSESTLRRWFANGQHYPAVILGRASGGLVCRDFDVQGAYDLWAQEHWELAGRLPTVCTARGRHVYFVSKWQGFTKLADGELRGDSRHYCLVPPSVHPLGVLYEWQVPLPAGGIPLIDPFSVGLAVAQSPCPVTEEDRGKQKEHTSSVVEGDDGETEQRVRGAIALTIPAHEGQRNQAVFEFCRQLKGIPALADLPPDPLKPFVKEWHAAALPVIGTKPFAETWIDFLKGWPRVKWAANREFLPMIVQRAEADPLGAYDEPRIGVLAGVCRELAKVGGDGFYLATRTAGRLLDVSPMTISRWLFLLEHDGVIKTVEKGGTSENPRKATRFRYCGPKSGAQGAEKKAKKSATDY